MAECVEPFDIATALDSVGSLAAGTVREFARDAGGDKKGEKRDPVLRIGDGKCADGGQEIVVKREHGDNGHEHGNSNAPYRRNG